MATAREGTGGGGGRERRTNSFSNSPLPQLKKPAPKPSSSQPSSPSSQKPLPNYLRPTISSSQATQASPDFTSSSRSFRRSNYDSSASTNTKPSTDKRRSYDKPPSPALLQKALHAANTREFKNLRPTSSSGTRTAPSIKPAPQRSFSSLSSRSTKAPERSTVRSFSAKASPSNSNNSLNKVASKGGPRTRSVTSESSVDFEGRDKDIMDHVIGGKDETRCESDQYEAQSLPEISEKPDQEEKLGVPATVVKAEVEARNEEDVSPQGPSKAVAEEVIQEQETAGKEDDQPTEPLVEEEKNRTDKSNEEIVEEAYHANQGKGAEENGMEEDSPKVEEKHVVVEQEGSAEGSKDGEETSAAAVHMKIESPVEVKAYESPNDAKADESPAEAKAYESPTEAKADVSPVEAKANESPAKAKADESPATAKAERPAKQTYPGKKGTPANNDVIEETASKLMDKKNRVRALAGAFETVMQK